VIIKNNIFLVPKRKKRKKWREGI